MYPLSSTCCWLGCIDVCVCLLSILTAGVAMEQSLVPAPRPMKTCTVPGLWGHYPKADKIKPPCRHRWLGVIDVILMMAVPILCVVTNNLLPIITVKQTPKNINSHRSQQAPE